MREACFVAQILCPSSLEHKEEVIAPKKSVPEGDRGNPEVTRQLDALGKEPTELLPYKH